MYEKEKLAEHEVVATGDVAFNSYAGHLQESTVRSDVSRQQRRRTPYTNEPLYK